MIRCDPSRSGRLGRFGRSSTPCLRTAGCAITGSIAWGFLVSLALAACGGGADEGDTGAWNHESETLGDTVVVRTIAGSVWGDTMVLVPEIAIGEAEGEEPYLFGQPSAMVLDPAGQIHVLDHQAREVRTFGSDGRHLRSFGGQGQGPGEFTDPDGMRLLPDGRLVIRDQQGGRFSIFDSDGSFVDSWPIRSGFITSTPFQVVTAETGPEDRVQVSNPSLLSDADTPMDQWRPIRVRYLVADPAVQDTLPVPTSGFEASYVEARTENSVSRTALPFSRQEHWTEFADGSTAWGISGTYAVLRLGAEGPLLRMERMDDPVPVDAEHAAAERERITENFRRMDPTWRWRAGDIPVQKPWFTALLPGEDGTLWVLRSTRSEAEANPSHDPDDPRTGPATRWVEPHPVADVFDVDGRYLGPVRLPRGFAAWRTPWMSTDAVVAVRTHELGHHQVVLYRLVPAAEVDG